MCWHQQMKLLFHIFKMKPNRGQVHLGPGQEAQQVGIKALLGLPSNRRLWSFRNLLI